MELTPEYIKNQMASRGITSYSTEIVQYLLQRTTAIKTVYLFGGNKFHYLLDSSDVPNGTLLNSETGYLEITEKMTKNFSLILFRGQLRITTTASLGTAASDVQLYFLRITPNY